VLRAGAASPAASGMVERNGAEIVEYITKKGKKLRGIIRTDLSKEQAQAIDPFTFKQEGGYFIREKYLQPEASKDTKSQRIDEPGNAKDNSTDGTIDIGPEAQYNIRVLGGDTADHTGTPRAEVNALHPYDARVLPGDAEIRQIAASFGSRVQGFGLRSGLLAADVERFGFFNGVRTGKTIFIAAKGNTRPHMAILGLLPPLCKP
jgi:hypothetical protein